MQWQLANRGRQAGGRGTNKTKFHKSKLLSGLPWITEFGRVAVVGETM